MIFTYFQISTIPQNSFTWHLKTRELIHSNGRVGADNVIKFTFIQTCIVSLLSGLYAFHRNMRLRDYEPGVQRSLNDMI